MRKTTVLLAVERTAERTRTVLVVEVEDRSTRPSTVDDAAVGALVRDGWSAEQLRREAARLRATYRDPGVGHGLEVARERLAESCDAQAARMERGEAA